MSVGESELMSEPAGSGLILRWLSSPARWLWGRATGPKASSASLDPVERFRNVCITREAGAGGGLIARLVGARLNWKVYNHEIVDTIAERMEVDVEVVRALDELAPGVVQDWLLPLREEYYAPQEAYLDHLAKLIQAIGHTGHAVIVGRGANFIVPREETLSVRIIAPLKDRAQFLAEQMGVSARTARRAAQDLDYRRARFVRTMYRANLNDEQHYDMVLDSSSLTVPIAVEVIVRAVEAGQPPKPAAEAELPAPPLAIEGPDRDTGGERSGSGSAPGAVG